jgi:gliding motility-associated-like protein
LNPRLLVVEFKGYCLYQNRFMAGLVSGIKRSVSPVETGIGEGCFHKKNRSKYLALILLLIFVNNFPAYSRSNINDEDRRKEFSSFTHLNKLYSSVPKIVFNVSDSIASQVKKNDKFAAPKFAVILTGEVFYDREYSRVINVKSSSTQEILIKAIQKPDWLKLTSEPQVRILAGSEAAGSANGMGSKARFSAPYALASDLNGNIYVADQVDNRIRKISPVGEVSTVAGTLNPGFKDGAGTEAQFNMPSGIAIDHRRYIFISDQQNHSIRRISPEGVVITLAGSQQAGYVDGNASNARFNSPAGICVDASGFVYIADRGNNRIRVISPEGKVSTLAGNGQPGYSEGKGTAAKFNVPTGIAVDKSGNIFVTDQVNNRIRKINPEGVVSTFAGSGEFSLSDGESNKAAFKYPTGIVFDTLGNLYVTDQINHLIRRISPSGKVTSMALSSENDPKTGKAALSLKNPTGICFNNDGDVFVADYHNYNVKVIALNALISGTPSRSNVGVHEIILEASNEFGSSVQSGRLIVKDNVGPAIESTYPANLSSEIPRTLEAVFTFDEAVSLCDSGSITVSNVGHTVVKYNIQKAVADKTIEFSDDQRSFTFKLSDLPPASTLRITLDDGIVMDSASNLFQNAISPLASWSFTTRNKEKQSIVLPEFASKTYGDSDFKLGPLYSSAGLPVEYIAEDPNMLLIKGDTVKILKAGITQIIAYQKGDSKYLEEKISRTLTIFARPVVIKPIEGQVFTYGKGQPTIKYEIVSGSLFNGDSFTGQLEKTKGDTVGIYNIAAGVLTAGTNYNLQLLGGTLAIQKAPLLIKAENKTKIAGTTNPKFSVSYLGFVKGDSTDDLLIAPELTCEASDWSAVGDYSIHLKGALAKNYYISYQSGILKISTSGTAEFTVKHFDLLENMPAGTFVASLIKNKAGVQTSIFSLTPGIGDEDNTLFKINGNSIALVSPLDYENKHEFSVRVKSEGSYGEMSEKQITISIKDVNERPKMDKIPFDIVCSNGIIQLTGVTAGPEKGQEVKMRVEDLRSKSFLLVSQPENGKAHISYKVPAGFGSILNLRIILTDNGGNANGGIDSTVYTYSFNVVRQTPVQITSEQGSILLRGTTSILEAKNSGNFQWYFNGKRIAGEESKTLNFTASESGTVGVQVISREGCIIEAKMEITVVDSPPVACTNLISPNFDGINDAFVVRNIEHYPGNELWIMDQNGRVVFNQKNYSNNWKGTLHDSVLPIGSYYYLLDLGNKTAKLKGYISLIN